MNPPLPPSKEVILIRSMQVEDLEQVQAIDQVSFSMPWPSSAYKYELNENPLSLLWVAEASSQGSPLTVVGMIIVWLILDEAHIATIAVDPNYRGRRIAHRMLAVALTESIKLGSHLATLEVRASNAVAQHLYRNFLFEIVGNRLRYYRDNNEDALIMTVDNLDGAYLQWLQNRPWMEKECLGDARRNPKRN
jgi:[ribosomal protein S18]-alanine N-acetyltransferase